MTQPTRREFTGSAAAGLTALSAGRVLGANERIRLGFIGLGNRGDQVLDSFLPHKDAEVVAVAEDFFDAPGLVVQAENNFVDLRDLAQEIDLILKKRPIEDWDDGLWRVKRQRSQACALAPGKEDGSHVSLRS